MPPASAARFRFRIHRSTVDLNQDLKAHAAEVIRDLAEQGEPMVITQNGEAKVVIQDVRSYEETQEGKIVSPAEVYAYLIADGRRDMQTLLTRRLLRGE